MKSSYMIKNLVIYQVFIERSQSDERKSLNEVFNGPIKAHDQQQSHFRGYQKIFKRLKELINNVSNYLIEFNILSYDLLQSRFIVYPVKAKQKIRNTLFKHVRAKPIKLAKLAYDQRQSDSLIYSSKTISGKLKVLFINKLDDLIKSNLLSYKRQKPKYTEYLLKSVSTKCKSSLKTKSNSLTMFNILKTKNVFTEFIAFPLFSNTNSKTRGYEE